ncbi:A24 family peptidase [Clostridium sp. BJN0001]|uniref:prepilin peptidase n=1 Tax=Clostridium sp. BJN0001 TaxID=2930219 RepID=UPI001FCF878D|nr:A24 family peptidase [Clostridium sp. BJN0001]
MNCFLIVLIGLVVGSFLNICIFRIPKEKPNLFSKSHCVLCGHKLKILDVIPVLSYIVLKGKCRYCKDRISIEYPIIEILNTIFYVLIYYMFGINIISIKYMFLVSILIVIAMIDLKTKYIYDSTFYLALAIGSIFLAISFFQNKDQCLELFLGAVAGFLIIGSIVIVTHGMGEGDIEVASICGLFLGIRGLMLTLFLAVLIGSFEGIMVTFFKHKDLKYRIAFGPSIAAGTILTIFCGKTLFDSYMNLFI